MPGTAMNSVSQDCTLFADTAGSALSPGGLVS